MHNIYSRARLRFSQMTHRMLLYEVSPYYVHNCSMLSAISPSTYEIVRIFYWPTFESLLVSTGIPYPQVYAGRRAAARQEWRGWETRNMAEGELLPHYSSLTGAWELDISRFDNKFVSNEKRVNFISTPFYRN